MIRPRPQRDAWRKRLKLWEGGEDKKFSFTICTDHREDTEKNYHQEPTQHLSLFLAWLAEKRTGKCCFFPFINEYGVEISCNSGILHEFQEEIQSIVLIVLEGTL